MTNNQVGCITAENAPEIVKTFGERGKQIAQQLAADDKATMLGLLFENFTESKKNVSN